MSVTLDIYLTTTIVGWKVYTSSTHTHTHTPMLQHKINNIIILKYYSRVEVGARSNALKKLLIWEAPNLIDVRELGNHFI